MNDFIGVTESLQQQSKALQHQSKTIQQQSRRLEWLSMTLRQKIEELYEAKMKIELLNKCIVTVKKLAAQAEAFAREVMRKLNDDGGSQSTVKRGAELKRKKHAVSVAIQRLISGTFFFWG